MDRRAFLIRKPQHAPATTMRLAASGLDPYSGAWTRAEATHLLKRTMFGATRADVDHIAGLDVSSAVDELLNTLTTPGYPLRDYGTVDDGVDTYDDPGAAMGQTWINDFNTTVTGLAASEINHARNDSLRKWLMGTILNQSRSIGEKMIVFWHHHFSVQREEVETANLMYNYHALLRSNVLGNIRALTKEVSKNPAMLKHLNGYLNSKLAPDENYARELQELFTIGKGPASGYTEDDVREAARVLTGWRIDQATLQPAPEDRSHDSGTKTFSAFYNNKTINGSSCEQELDELTNMIFDTDECPRFICRKLYRYFVYSEITPATEANVIAPLAQVLKANNFEMKPVLSALLKSEHFFDLANRGCYIKSPFDIIVGTLRELEIPFPASTDVNGYALFGSLANRAENMLQDLWQPPDVSGWPAYYLDPIFYEYWVNSNSLPARADFTDNLVADNLVDVLALANRTSDPANPDVLVAELSDFLLRYPLSGGSKTYTKNKFLIPTGADDSAWTNAWSSNNSSVTVPALKNLVQFLMNLPEYHLC